jgi:hypothetical protein
VDLQALRTGLWGDIVGQSGKKKFLLKLNRKEKRKRKKGQHDTTLIDQTTLTV